MLVKVVPERELAHENLVHHHPAAPEVRPVIVVPHEDLGRPVRRRSRALGQDVGVLRVAHSLAAPKVDALDGQGRVGPKTRGLRSWLARDKGGELEHEVGGLDVRKDKALVVAVVDAVEVAVVVPVLVAVVVDALHSGKLPSLDASRSRFR